MLPQPSPPSLPSAPRAMPSAAMAYVVVPMSSLVGLVLVAALHDYLGAPLGPLWAADLWGWVKSGVVVGPLYLGVANRLRAHNARMEALYAHVIAETSVTDGRISTTSSVRALPRRRDQGPEV